MALCYVAPGVRAWTSEEGRAHEQRYTAGDVGLSVLFEDGPHAGAVLCVPHLDWTMFVGRRLGRVACRFVPPGLPFRGVAPDSLMGCYVFDRPEEVMKWRELNTLEHVVLPDPSDGGIG